MAPRAVDRPLRLTRVAVLLVLACLLSLWPFYGLFVAMPGWLPLSSMRVELPEHFSAVFGEDWPRTPTMIEDERRRVLFSRRVHWPEQPEYVAMMGERSWPGVRMRQYHVRRGPGPQIDPNKRVLIMGFASPTSVELGWPLPMIRKVSDTRFAPEVGWAWSAKGIVVNLATTLGLVCMACLAKRAVMRWLRGRRGQCRGCGYVLMPGQGVCSECGLSGHISGAPA